MEAVEGLMEKLQLSAAERKGIKVGKPTPTSASSKEAQAIGKVLAEKLFREEGLKQTLGRIWCPIKGGAVQGFGGNHFLFTFLQAAGKKRALEEGPWMFGKDLVVMVDYEEEKNN